MTLFDIRLTPKGKDFRHAAWRRAVEYLNDGLTVNGRVKEYLPRGSRIEVRQVGTDFWQDIGELPSSLDAGVILKINLELDVVE